MDPSTTFTLPQMILAWTLLGILLIWMVIAAVLALRGLADEKLDMAELPTPSGSFPAVTIGRSFHTMTSVHVEMPLGAVHTETSNERGPAPVA